ncbi:hypothetical protein PFISCL1PPCAC_24418, partial [Pristionchus fissidentatus]
SSSPLKSSISENLLSKSSNTTSIPEISSLSSLSTTSKNEIVALKKKIDLLKVQLRQKNIEIDKNSLEKEAGVERKAEVNYLTIKCSVLSSVCDELNACISSYEIEEEKRLRQIERVFTTQLSQSNDISKALKEENGRFQAELRSNETKISSIVHENSFLRWENSSLSDELSQVKAKLEEEMSMKRVMKAEMNKAKTAHEKCGITERRERELTSHVDKSLSTIEKMKRIQDDREKEYGITLTRVNNELDFVKGEMERKEEVSKHLIEMIDRLSMDNKNLQDRIQERERIRLRETRKSLNSGLEQRLEIQSNDDQVRILTAKFEEERQWRTDLCRIHVEMSKDMRRLMELAQEGCTH